MKQGEGKEELVRQVKGIDESHHGTDQVDLAKTKN
ncbi:MAG: hypothetical protein ACI8PB_003958 [Desulforhopalus sp.]